MFAQMVPMFANDSIFAVQSVNNPDVNFVVALIALIANVAALAYVIVRSKKMGKNPYTNEIWVGTKEYREAMDRRASVEYLLETEPAKATEAEIAEMVAYAEMPNIPDPTKNNGGAGGTGGASRGVNVEVTTDSHGAREVEVETETVKRE